MSSIACEAGPAILIVEDDGLIRMAAADMMQDASFRVHEAANADEAIAVLEARTDIRIIFTDIEMPGAMNGLKLAQTVRRRWPPIKLIVTSGKVPRERADLPEGGLFFSKPYRPAEISAAMHRLLAARTAPWQSGADVR